MEGYYGWMDSIDGRTLRVRWDAEDFTLGQKFQMTTDILNINKYILEKTLQIEHNILIFFKLLEANVRKTLTLSAPLLQSLVWIRQGPGEELWTWPKIRSRSLCIIILSQALTVLWRHQRPLRKHPEVKATHPLLVRIFMFIFSSILMIIYPRVILTW